MFYFGTKEPRKVKEKLELFPNTMILTLHAHEQIEGKKSYRTMEFNNEAFSKLELHKENIEDEVFENTDVCLARLKGFTTGKDNPVVMFVYKEGVVEGATPYKVRSNRKFYQSNWYNTIVQTYELDETVDNYLELQALTTEEVDGIDGITFYKLMPHVQESSDITDAIATETEEEGVE